MRVCGVCVLCAVCCVLCVRCIQCHATKLNTIMADAEVKKEDKRVPVTILTGVLPLLLCAWYLCACRLLHALGVCDCVG